MITKLRLKDFKNFRDATLHLGRVTTLVGANASGKSNIRDAFRFLHGAARGYSLAQIFGTTYSQGGELVWEGIRGGSIGAPRSGVDSFEIEVHVEIEQIPGFIGYLIQASCPALPAFPHVKQELLFGEHQSFWQRSNNDATYFKSIMVFGTRSNAEYLHNVEGYPFLFQEAPYIPFELFRYVDRKPSEATVAREVIRDHLSRITFIDFFADTLRQPSEPAEDRLGARGENLASALFHLMKSDSRESLLGWLNLVLPLEIDTIEFERYGSRVAFVLVESGGTKIPAESASDGTVRFLGFLAALFTSKPERVLFFEEPENGIHPARLAYLVELIESEARSRQVQVILTTHSPEVLNALSDESREHASLMYRDGEGFSGEIRRLVDIPDIEKVMAKHGLGRLLSTRWLEQTVSFSLPDHPSEKVGG